MYLSRQFSDNGHADLMQRRPQISLLHIPLLFSLRIFSKIPFTAVLLMFMVVSYNWSLQQLFLPPNKRRVILFFHDTLVENLSPVERHGWNASFLPQGPGWPRPVSRPFWSPWHCSKNYFSYKKPVLPGTGCLFFLVLF